jgi:uncharacterized protein YejL (UPF0352 family)
MSKKFVFTPFSYALIQLAILDAKCLFIFDFFWKTTKELRDLLRLQTRHWQPLDLSLIGSGHMKTKIADPRIVLYSRQELCQKLSGS